MDETPVSETPVSEPKLDGTRPGWSRTMPAQVRASGLLVVLQSVGVVVLAVAIAVSGFGHAAAVGQLLGQTAYYLVLAALAAVCGWALLTGRRWGRTPVIVMQIIIGAIGYWMAVPSGRPVLGVALILLALLTGGLLLTRSANSWITELPPPTAPAAPAQGR